MNYILFDTYICVNLQSHVSVLTYNALKWEKGIIRYAKGLCDVKFWKP